MRDDGGSERTAWLLIAAGMLVRLVWALLVPVQFQSDSYAYHHFATMLLDHGVYGWTPDAPSAYWPVGTSAIAAASVAVFGRNDLATEAPNLIAAAVMLRMTWLVGRVWIGAHAALWALALMAFWPNLILFTTVLASELPFIALTMLGTCLWVRGGLAALVLAGLVWGLACFVRPVILLFPVALALAGLRAGPRGLLLQAGRAALAIALIIAVVSPWSARNQRLFGERVLVSTNFGPNLWMGNNPDTTGGYMPLPPEAEALGETERARLLGDAAKSYIASDPVGFVGRTLAKVLRLHERETIGVVWNGPVLEAALSHAGLTAVKLLATLYWYAVLLLALVGMALGLRRDGVAALMNPALLGWGYFTALHAVTVVEDRYHMPSAPFIALLAGPALLALARRRQWQATPKEI